MCAMENMPRQGHTKPQQENNDFMAYADNAESSKLAHFRSLVKNFLLVILRYPINSTASASAHQFAAYGHSAQLVYLLQQNAKTNQS